MATWGGLSYEASGTRRRLQTLTKDDGIRELQQLTTNYNKLQHHDNNSKQAEFTPKPIYRQVLQRI